jgi:2-methylcitrate dehydratase PrpD
MASKHTHGENKRHLTHDLADWASALKYEDLNSEATPSAKLSWYTSIGCALGGSQQREVKIALDHFRQMVGTPSCIRFVSDFKTNLWMWRSSTRR